MPLSGFRILQIGSGIALDYRGKLFSDFGADVVRLEPSGGDPMRSFPPLLDGCEIGLFARLNTNKRSVTEMPEAPDELLSGADLVLDGRKLAGLYDRRSSVSVHKSAVSLADSEAAVAWDASASRKHNGINGFARNYPVDSFQTNIVEHKYEKIPGSSS